jgi:hypothetical protein
VLAWTYRHLRGSRVGVLDDAHVSLFIITENAAEADEDRVLWVGRNLTDA